MVDGRPQTLRVLQNRAAVLGDDLCCGTDLLRCSQRSVRLFQAGHFVPALCSMGVHAGLRLACATLKSKGPRWINSTKVNRYFTCGMVYGTAFLGTAG